MFALAVARDFDVAGQRLLQLASRKSSISTTHVTFCRIVFLVIGQASSQQFVLRFRGTSGIGQQVTFSPGEPTGHDIVAFLGTLSDGYFTPKAVPSGPP
jgi:hypothetical protein